MRTLYGRGLNIVGNETIKLGQIDSSYKNYQKFTPISALSGYTVVGLGCGYLQSYYLLSDGQLIRAGYEMETLTNARILNIYRIIPFLPSCFKVLLYLDNKVNEKNWCQIEFTT
jgi:hypothetical protein